METIKSKNVLGQEPAPIPAGQELVTVRIAVALAVGEVLAGNVVELAVLPGDCVPVSYVLESTDLDTNGAPTITADFGIVNEAGTAISVLAADGGDEWIDGSTLPQAGGIVLNTASKAAYDVLKAVQDVETDRIVGVVFATGAATAAAGTVSLELTYKAA